MHIAKQAFLPATKTMPRHRHRNRYVDPNHANLNAATKFARDVAIACVARHAIAKFVCVDQINRLTKVVDAYATEHRAKNFFFVNAHRRGNVIKQTAASKKALLVSGNFDSATIDDKSGAFVDANFDIAFDAFKGLACHDGAHFGVEFKAIFDFECFSACGKQGYDFVSHIAH